MHARAPGGLANGFRIVPVVLTAFDIRFDVLRWNETHRLTERGKSRARGARLLQASIAISVAGNA
jgi:hypothetical protein